MLRYTVLRLLVFFGCLLLLWLAGLRGPDQQVWLLLGSAGASFVLSYFLLRRPREEFAATVEARIARRREARRRASGSDEEAEDAQDMQDAALEDGARPNER